MPAATAAHLPLDEELVFAPGSSRSLVAFDDALEQRTKQFPRRANVGEMRYFGGLTVEGTALGLINTDPNSVFHDWAFAKAWLNRELSERVEPKRGLSGLLRSVHQPHIAGQIDTRDLQHQLAKAA